MPKFSDKKEQRKKEQFLVAYREHGTIGYACEESGVSRKFIRGQIDNDPIFAEACVEAVEHGIDELEAIAKKRAIDSSDTLLIFLLKSKRRDVFGDRLQVGIESTALDKLVSGLIGILNKIIPRACPSCKTNLNLHEPIAQALIEASTVKASE